MFTTEGAFVTYDLAKKVVVKNNGVKQDGEGADDVFAELEAAVAAQTVEADALANVAKRLVTFKLNSSDEIKEIDLISKESTSSTSFNATTEKFLGKYFTSKSVLIMAPVSLDSTTSKYIVDEDDLALSAFSALDEDTAYAKSFIFDVNRKNEIGVAISSDEVSTSAANAMAVVLKKRTITDDRIKLDVFQAGETVSYVVAEDCTAFDSVSAGDVIQFNLAADEIVKGYIVYDLSTTTLNSSLPTAISTGIKYAFNTGDVDDVKSRYAVIDGVDISFASEQGTVALWNLDKSSSPLSKLSDLSSLKVSTRYATNYIVYRTNDDGDIIDAIQYIAQ
jgi:hypothetical protein